AYAEERIVPAANAVALPEGISYEAAASMMLKGLTAEYLLHRTHKVKPGDTILVHAAAGATGLILCQWGKALG
ncbi:quinone oxidoreductase, partial [Bacillus toyonensis]